MAAVRKGGPVAQTLAALETPDLQAVVQVAFELGRKAREAELRDLLAAADQAPRRGESAQPGGRKRGEAIAAQAKAWQDPAAIWAQQLLDQGRLASATPTRYDLAVHLAANWPDRPFQAEAVRPDNTTGPPSVENLSRRLIAKWKLRWPLQQ